MESNSTIKLLKIQRRKRKSNQG